MKRLYPVEAITGFAVVATIVLYQLLELPLRAPWHLYTRKVGSGGLMYAIGLLVALLLCRLQDIRKTHIDGVPRTREFTLTRCRETYFQVPNLIRDLRLVHAIGVMFAVFVNLKNLIPHMNSLVYDPALAEFEKQLFGGRFPAEYLLSVLGTGSAPYLSEGYTLFYPYMALITVIFILHRDLRLGQHFCFAFVLLWFLGILAEYSFPTWGPCFSYPELFTSLPYTEVTQMQEMLWRNKLFLEKFPKSEFGMYLISGVPSLHIAVTVQGSLYLNRINRTLAVLSWIFVGITSVTTIYFGWHFIIDDLAAVLLVLLANWIAHRCVPLHDST